MKKILKSMKLFEERAKVMAGTSPGYGWDMVGAPLRHGLNAPTALIVKSLGRF